jgi:hypothetical protein
MTVINTGATFTPEDLLRMQDAVKYELVDGKLVERNMGITGEDVLPGFSCNIAEFFA